jgi:hypothetical protein
MMSALAHQPKRFPLAVHHKGAEGVDGAGEIGERRKQALVADSTCQSVWRL